MFFVAQRIARSGIQFYFWQRIAATDDSIAQVNTPAAIFLIFFLYFTRAHAHNLVFFISRLHRPTISAVAGQVAEKIAYCDS